MKTYLQNGTEITEAELNAKLDSLENKGTTVTNLTLKQISDVMQITSSKSVQIEGLDYYYYNSKEADEACIAAYCEDTLKYTYLTVEHFMSDHGFESIQDLNGEINVGI